MSHREYDYILGGLLTASALLLPILFHALGLGSAFLPMLFPIALAGLLIDFSVAVSVGFISPLASALLTGMPPFYPPIALLMMIEGVVLAGMAALLHRRLHLPVWPSLAAALFAERLVLLVLVMAAGRILKLHSAVLGPAAVLHGLPGIALMLALIPPLAIKMEKRKREIMIFQ